MTQSSSFWSSKNKDCILNFLVGCYILLYKKLSVTLKLSLLTDAHKADVFSRASHPMNKNSKDGHAFCCRFGTGSIFQPPCQLTQKCWLPLSLLPTPFHILADWGFAYISKQKVWDGAYSEEQQNSMVFLIYFFTLKHTLHPPPSSLHVGIKVKPRQFNSSHCWLLLFPLLYSQICGEILTIPSLSS